MGRGVSFTWAYLILLLDARTNTGRYRVQGLLLGEPPTDRPRRRAGGRAILARPGHSYLDGAATCSAIEQLLLDVVNVDLHSARPGRGRIPCRLPNANIDKPSLGAFAAHLLAEEFRAGGEANREVERKRLARRGFFCVERPVVFCLKTVAHGNDRPFNDNPHRNGDFTRAFQPAFVPSTTCRATRCRAVACPRIREPDSRRFPILPDTSASPGWNGRRRRCGAGEPGQLGRRHDGFAALLALRIAVDELLGVPAREHGEAHKLLGDVDDPVIIG